MVHVLAPEHEAAFQPSSFIEKQRYMEEYWNHGVNWQLYNSGGERWFGFEAVRDLNGLPPEILMIPLPGHTRGHSCIAVKTYDGWLLHCGDGYFYHGQVDPHNPHCTKGLEVFQKAFAVDNELRIQNTYRLLDLAQNHGEEVTLFSAHDPCEFEHHQHMVHHG